MSLFKNHDWKEIARTYAPSFIGTAENFIGEQMERLSFEVTTILWECQDRDCQALRKQEMLGRVGK